MAVTRPCYCTRGDVQSALDVQATARSSDQLDRAIEAAADAVDGLCHRVFYPEDKTALFDWPTSQSGNAWRLWLDKNELADVTVNVPVVTTAGQVIPASQVFWGPWNYSPPFRFLELDRSSSAAFGAGKTPQRDIAVTGTFGYWLKTAPTGALAAAVSDTTSTTLTLTATTLGVGDVAFIGGERVLVQGKAMADTTIGFAGLTSASAADRVLAVPDGTQFAVGEVLGFDSERCLVTGITGNSLSVLRAWDGTVLAAHTSGTIYAARKLTVARGQLGTAAATHSNGAAVARSVVPPLITELAVAESINNLLQETAGYARTVGGGDTLQPISGAGLADVRARASARHGRSGRSRAI